MTLLLSFNVPDDENGIIFFSGHPRSYRADCKAGVIKIGESEIIGSSLDMEILSCREFPDALFNYPFQDWLEVFFVDKDNVVSHILFKIESINNFLELLRKLRIARVALGACIVTAQMSKRSNDHETYFAVEFSATNNESKRVKQLAEFVNANNDPRSCSRRARIYSARLTDNQKQLPGN